MAMGSGYDARPYSRVVVPNEHLREQGIKHGDRVNVSVTKSKAKSNRFKKTRRYINSDEY
jgi:bifunctional DNA-binding transcriptional regulator/antitoxin component of YhaV-PrlF toxin-antitoxin module